MKKTILVIGCCFLTGQLMAVEIRDRVQGSPISANLCSARAPEPQAGGAAQAQPQWKGGRPEYDAYMAVDNEKDATKRIALIDGFLAKYPESNMKPRLAYMLMQAYQRLNDLPGASKAAREVLKIKADNISALFLLSYAFHVTYKPGSSDEAAVLSRAASDAKSGLEALKKVQKPANASDSQFAQSIKTRRVMFNNTVGFVALQQEDYPVAVSYLTKVAEESPDDPLLFYRLGLAHFYSGDQGYDKSVWILARAASLASAKGEASESQIRKFLTQAYVRRYESEGGLEEILKQATASADPPEGFTVPHPPGPPASATPSEAVFHKLAHPLRGGGDTAERIWNRQKGQEISMAGKVDGWERGASAGQYRVRIDLLSDDSNKERGVYDVVVLVSGQPKARNLAPGDVIRFKGNFAEYEAKPRFVYTLDKGRINPEDLPEFAPGQAPVVKPTRERRIRGG